MDLGINNPGGWSSSAFAHSHSVTALNIGGNIAIIHLDGRVLFSFGDVVFPVSVPVRRDVHVQLTA